MRDGEEATSWLPPGPLAWDAPLAATGPGASIATSRGGPVLVATAGIGAHKVGSSRARSNSAPWMGQVRASDLTEVTYALAADSRWRYALSRTVSSMRTNRSIPPVS